MSGRGSRGVAGPHPRTCGLGSWPASGSAAGDSWAPGPPLPNRLRVRAPSVASALSCSYTLSCELEPPSESASSTLKVKKNTAIVKRWSE